MGQYVSEYIEVIKQKTNIEPNSFLEIGARDKDNAELLCKEFNIESERIYLIEPHPKSFELLKSGCDYNVYPQAFSNKPGKKYFYALDSSVGVSSLNNRKDNFYEKTGYQKILTEVITAEQFLLQEDITSIDICKIDVEGHSYEVIEGFGERLRDIKSIHVECETREIWENQKIYNDVRKYLSNAGMKCLKVINVNGHLIQIDSIWTWPEYIKE